MLKAVVAAGVTCAALALLMASAPVRAQVLAPAEDAIAPQPGGTALQIQIDGADDPRWELTRIDVLLDGAVQVPAEAAAADDESGQLREDQRGDEEEAAGRPVWSGVVAPGPHTLAALLFFRPRNPDLDGNVGRVVRLEGRHLFPARPIRPLVLLDHPGPPDASAVGFCCSPATRSRPSSRRYGRPGRFIVTMRALRPGPTMSSDLPSEPPNARLVPLP